MITTTLVLILGALLAIVLWKLFQKAQTPAAPAKPVEDLSSMPVSKARPGDVISISGAGKDFSDLDFNVDRREEFTSGGKSWVELSGSHQGSRVSIEVRDEGEPEMFAVLDSRRLTLEDLDVSEDDLGQIDERQNTGDNFEYQGKLWNYRFSREVRSSRDGVPGPAFYCWRFLEEGGARAMTIRKPEGEPFFATLATKVNPRDVSVFRGA